MKSQSRHARSPILVALGLALLPGRAPAEDKRFDPARAFPLECVGYLQVPSGKALAEALSRTLIGRLAQDGEIRAALGSLPEMLREHMLQLASPLIEATGRGPLELLDLLQGELALSVTGFDPVAKVSVVAAVELGARREAILAVLKKVAEGLAGAPDAEPPSVEVGGKKAALLRFPGGAPPIYHLVLGTHLVLSTSMDALGGVVEAFGGAPGSADFTLLQNPRYAEARGALELRSLQFLAFLNVEAVRSVIMTFLSRDPGSRDLVKALGASGLLSITALGYSLGERDGDVEAKLLLGAANGADGLLGQLLEALEAPADPLRALPLVPARASAVGAAGIQGGKALRAIESFLREGLPLEAAHEFDGFLRAVLDRTGLSLEKDLFALGKLDLHLFLAAPPAGGLLPDLVALVRTEELAPYRKALEKVAGALGKEPQKLGGPGGRAITYLRAGSVFTRLVGKEPAPPPQGLLEALAQPPISIALAELDGGWTVLAPSPQPVWRYLEKGPGGPARSTGEGLAPLAARLRSDLAGAPCAVAFRPGGLLLAVYNSAASFLEAMSLFLQPFLAPHGVDLSLLPPGEKFLDELKDGFVRIDAGPKGLRLHGHRVLSNAGGLVALLMLFGGGAAAAGG